jgi:hypothetical protein
MKKYLLTLSIISFLFAASTHAFATGQNIDGQIISYVGTGWGAEGFYVQTTTPTRSMDGCGSMFWIDPNHPLRKEMMALLISAFHSGTKVNLYVDNCVNTNAMILKAVAIQK